MNYPQLLKKGNYHIGVWGTGYIGFSTMAFFARQGIKVIGYDISKEKVEIINSGGYIFKELKSWLNFSIKPLVKQGYIKATLNYLDFIKYGVIVHFVAVPTEKDGAPYFGILSDTIKKISSLVKNSRNPARHLIIIESTLSPRTSDTVIIPLFEKNNIKTGKDILYGVAPRRDWFVDNGKNLRHLDRVFGGCDIESSKAMEEVLGIVCKKLHKASSCYVAEMVKSFENAYRHVEITLANQISLAYPSQDIREALILAGTKWNIGTFKPGFGTGGYCIPVASKYVIGGAEAPTELSILKDTLKTDRKINIQIAKSIIKKGLKKIAVLGLSYKGNLKVSILSPTIPFVQALIKSGVGVKIFDPHFSSDEIREILDIPTFQFPEEMKKFDGVVLIVNHKEYILPGIRLFKNLNSCKFILDNTGLWSKHRAGFEKMNIEYHLSGDANWI